MTTATTTTPAAEPVISIGLIAWNEAEAIGAALESLLRQTLFAELRSRGLACEILCVANGCTDRTADIARRFLDEQLPAPPWAGTVSGRVVEIAERGKLNAWNRYVHEFSARGADVLFLMDGDIVLHEPATLWNMVAEIRAHPEAAVSVDQPLKDIGFSPGKNLRHRLSLAASRMTQANPAQLSGQLYAINAEVARNIYLPRDLAACEDGFIKAIVCTDFLERAAQPGRIRQAPQASHVFAAYTSLGDVLRNQQRQMIGQTMVHLLVDDYLPKLPAAERRRLGEALRRRDETEPAWLKRVLAAHLHRTRFFWRLYPGLLSGRFARWARLDRAQRLRCLPAMLAGLAVSLIAAWRAHRFLKRGATDYWPDTRSPQLDRFRNGTGAVHSH